MKEEIKDLRRRIHENERELAKLENMIVTDSVTRGTNLKKIFGDAVTTMNSGAVVMNGDGGATDAHFQNATWQNNRLYATFSSSMNKNIRVTGLIYYAPGTVLDNGTF